MKGELLQMQHQVKEISNTQKEMLKAIQNLTINTKPQGNIVVIGGQSGYMVMSSSWLDSVEMYSLANQTWSKLAPMQEKRASPTAHFYNGRVMVTGGRCGVSSASRSIEHIQIPGRDLPVRASLDALFPAELPFEFFGHKTAILHDHLWLVGGASSHSQASCSDAISMKPVHSTGAYQVKCRMPKPLLYHALEVVNNEILIIGGSTNGGTDGIKTVLSYNTATNALRELHPLPFPMVLMGTIKHGDDVIIIGGGHRNNEYLNTVFKYNHKKRECEQLPGMKYKRGGCAAVISGNKVFVMGGYNDEQGYLSSVECFDLESRVWHELPPMSEAKYKIAAVLVP